MNILIDLSPLKAGGGCQLALNFIEQLCQKETSQRFYILTPSTGPLADISSLVISRNHIECYTAPSNIYQRIIFEYYYLQKFLRKKNITLIYTFFGAGLPHPKDIQSIVSVAYPIICYPESPFWKYLPLLKKIKQKILNKARIVRLKKADSIVVETEIMKKRLSKILTISENKIYIIPPSPSNYVEETHSTKRSDNKINFLFLSGLGNHKNLWRLYDIAVSLEKSENTNFIFTITVKKEDYLNHLQKKIDITIIDRFFHFSGTTHPKEIDNLYKNADFIVSLSDLESFSNNYMEAWKANIPLIVSDRDFSRYICGESAFYIDPHNIPDIVSLFEKILLRKINNKDLEVNLTEGKKRLSQLPTQAEKTDIILNLILNKI